MAQLTLSFDFSRCSGCYSCVVACQDQNDFTDDKVALRQVMVHESGQYPSAIISYVSISCFHCEDAPCLMACPTGAIFRIEKNGIVDFNRELCVGCHSCELACPFGSPKFPEDRLMIKCDLCSIRLDQGMEPACVRVCPTGALSFGTLEEISKLTTRKTSRNILYPFN
ncbi:MAG: 4Fe-4S dicluster domain-containing protein [Deltaproteobacteria bacterium]|nr:4Fe-4S dicluster domain-containing protein [Deltaproteobacteria bacterium]